MFPFICALNEPANSVLQSHYWPTSPKIDITMLTISRPTQRRVRKGKNRIFQLEGWPTRSLAKTSDYVSSHNTHFLGVVIFRNSDMSQVVSKRGRCGAKFVEFCGEDGMITSSLASLDTSACWKPGMEGFFEGPGWFISYLLFPVQRQARRNKVIYYPNFIPWIIFHPLDYGLSFHRLLVLVH